MSPGSTSSVWTGLLLDDDEGDISYGPSALGGDVGGEQERDGVSVVAGRIVGEPAVVIEYGSGRGGSSPSSVSNAKVARGIEIASSLDCSLVVVVNGGGGQAPDVPFYRERRDIVRMLVSRSREKPALGVATGPVWGARSLMLGTCDAVIGLPGTTISLGDGTAARPADGDAALEGCGGIDVRAEHPSEGAEVVRRFIHLTTVPDTGADASRTPDPSLAAGVVPENARRAIDGRRAMDAILDPGTKVVLLPRYGGSLQIAIGRLDGRAIGVMASHSMVKAGAIDAAASDKMARFTALCHRFDLPIVQMTDVPGLLAGPEAEATAVNRHSTRPFFEQVRATIPHLSVVMRRAYGQGMIVMGMGGHFPAQVLRVMWPTGQFGGMGLRGAASITATSSARIGLVERDEVHEDLSRHGTAGAMAERFEVDDVISPEETRERLRRAVRLVASGRAPRPFRLPVEPW